MAYNFPNIKQNENNTYGPTSKKHYYLPVSYHNPTAKKREDKNRWCLKPPCQFEVFRVAEENYDINQANKGIYGFLDDANEILGKDNEERFAFFPDGGNNPWHGYPIRSIEIDDNVVKKWKEAKLISTRTYKDILKRNI